MTTKTDPDTVLASRCLDLLRHAKRPLCSVTLARLTGEHSSEIFRLLSKHPDVTVSKGPVLTMFEAK